MNPAKHPSEIDILAYIDGELDISRGHEIQAHCDDCYDCLELLTGFREIQGRLDDEVPMAIPLSVWPGVEKELQNKRRVDWGPAFGFGLSAAVAAGLTMGLLMGEPVNTGSPQQDTVAWASADYLWNSTGDSALLTTFSVDQSEGTGEL